MRLLMSWMLLTALAWFAPAHAADVCPILRMQTASPDVATRIAAVACEQNQVWHRAFIDADGRLANFTVTEAKTETLTTGEQAWQRVAAYWNDSGMLRQAYARPGASECAYAGSSNYPSPSCRAFLLDVPWSAAFVSYVMHRAGVPGFNGSPSHVSYVRDAYRNSANHAYRIVDPMSAHPQAGDMLCYVRVPSRVFGFAGLAAMLANSRDGLNMHCDIVVATNPGGDHLAYLVGGNVADAVTMRLLRLDANGRFAALPLRTAGSDPECSPDTPAGCNMNRQDWAVLMQLRSDSELAQLPPAARMPMSTPTSVPQRQDCCVNCVVGSGIPRCPQPELQIIE